MLGEGWSILIEKTHHVNQTINYEVGAIFVWGCMTSCGMGHMCKIEGKMTQALYFKRLYIAILTLHMSYFIMIMITNILQNFNLLTWPPQSIDIYSMELLWALVEWK